MAGHLSCARPWRTFLEPPLAGSRRTRATEARRATTARIETVNEISDSAVVAALRRQMTVAVARQVAAAGLIVEASFTSIPDMASRSYWYVPAAVLTQRYASIDKIAAVKLPLLFMHGKADGVVPYQMSERLHAAATSAKRLVLMEDAGHSNMSWKFSAEYLRAVRGFFAELGPGGPAGN